MVKKSRRMTIGLCTDRATNVYTTTTKEAFIEITYGYPMINEKTAYEIRVVYDGDKPRLIIKEN